MPSEGDCVSAFKSAFSWLINTSSVDGFLNLRCFVEHLQFSYEGFARHSERPAKKVSSNPGSAPSESSRLNGPLKTGSLRRGSLETVNHIEAGKGKAE